MSRTRREYTQAQKEEMVTLRKQGVPIKDIAAKFQAVPASVKYICKLAGVVLDKSLARENQKAAIRKHGDDTIEAITKMVGEGKTHKEIGDELGISKSQVDNLCFTYQIEAVQNKGQFDPIYPPELVAQIQGMRETGLPVSTICDLTKLGYHTVKYLIEKNHIKIDKTKKRESRVTAAIKAQGFVSIEEKMAALAATFGGKFIGQAKDYITNKHVMKFQCSKGHEFVMRPVNIVAGQKCPECSPKDSEAQKEIYEYVKSLGVEVEYGNRSVIAPKELDLYAPFHKLGIEYNGLYWHSEASPGFKPQSHVEKFNLCEQAGINLLAIYSDEWLHKQELVKAMIRWRCHKFSGKYLNARSLELVRLEHNKEFEQFFERNHLDGQAKSQFAYALLHEGEIVACASFRRHLQTGLLELARLATDYDYSVRGGASKLLSLIAEPLISYSNNRLSTGDVYKTLGFEETTETKQANYWYTDGHIRIDRHKCRRINEPEILALYPTEKEQAAGGVFGERILGKSVALHKIEDYGNKRWLRKPNLQPINSPSLEGLSKE